MKRRNPSIGVLMIISLTIIILTLVTRKTLWHPINDTFCDTCCV
ncbi:Hok/Gef family protein [Enterobacter sp. 9-2]